MLENWGWEPKVLKKISSHYKTQEHLPDDLIEKLIKRFVRFSQSLSSRWAVPLIVSFFFHSRNSRYVNAGLFYLRQLFFAKFDIQVHTDQGTCSNKTHGQTLPRLAYRTKWPLSDLFG